MVKNDLGRKRDRPNRRLTHREELHLSNQNPDDTFDRAGLGFASHDVSLPDGMVTTI